MAPIPADKKTAYGKIAAESGGFAIAEMVSMGVSLGVVGIADQIAPGPLKEASQVIGKYCIEPFLDTIEGGLSKVCKLKECQPDMKKSREERAEALAKTVIVFSAAWAASMAAKLYTRGVINRWTGVNPHELPTTGNWFKDQVNTIAEELRNPETRKIFVADEGIHYGSILLMNTVGAPITDDMINSTANILTKCGVPAHKAKEVSSMAIIWELPNLLGMLSGIGAIAHNHLNPRTHVEKLLASREAALLNPNLSKS